MEIKIGGKTVIGIGEMHYTAMRIIFEKSKVTAVEERILEESIQWWSNNLNNLDKTTRWELKRIINALVGNENGRFDRVKELMIREKIDWRKMYKAGLPFLTDEMVKMRKH